MRRRFLKPRSFGRRMCSGIWPPSFQAERLQRPLRGFLLADRALVLADLEATHETATVSSLARFRRSRPRVSATVSADRSVARAAIVAMTTFTGFVLPRDLDRMSWM